MVKKIPKGTRSLGKVGQNVYNSCIGLANLIETKS